MFHFLQSTLGMSLYTVELITNTWLLLFEGTFLRMSFAWNADPFKIYLLKTNTVIEFFPFFYLFMHYRIVKLNREWWKWRDTYYLYCEVVGDLIPVFFTTYFISYGLLITGGNDFVSVDDWAYWKEPFDWCEHKHWGYLISVSNSLVLWHSHIFIFIIFWSPFWIFYFQPLLIYFLMDYYLFTISFLLNPFFLKKNFYKIFNSYFVKYNFLKFFFFKNYIYTYKRFFFKKKSFNLKIYTLYRDLFNFIKLFLFFLNISFFFENFIFFKKKYNYYFFEYVEWCINLCYIVKMCSKHTSAWNVFIFVSIASLFNVFYFHTLNYNINLTHVKKKIFNRNIDKFYINYNMGAYTVFYSYIYKFIFHNSFWKNVQSSSFTFHRTFVRFPTYFSKFRFKQKFKLKFRTKPYPSHKRYKWNLTKIITKNYFMWRGDETRRRQRYVLHNYRLFFWCYVNDRIGVKVAYKLFTFKGHYANIRQFQNGRWFCRMTCYRYSYIYNYVKAMYWGYDNATYHSISVDRYHKVVLPNVKTHRSLQYFWKNMDMFAWQTPYSINNVTSYSNRNYFNRYYFEHYWKNRYVVWWRNNDFRFVYDKYKIFGYYKDDHKYNAFFYFFVRMFLQNNWCQDSSHFFFNNLSKPRIIKFFFRKVNYKRFWKKHVSKPYDWLDFSNFNFSNFNTPDFSDLIFIFNFFKNLF
jgi:hypothetical protein